MKKKISENQIQIEELIQVISILRDPDTGCEWDIKQTFESLLSYTIEEAYEVVDAIKSKDTNQIIDELGDLLLQIIYYAQIGKENKQFTFSDIAKKSKEKMIRRHPHIFNNNGEKSTITEIKNNWENIKKLEKNADPLAPFFIESLNNFPNLLKSYKIQKKSSNLNFDFSNIDQIFTKLDEETYELKKAIKNNDRDNIEEEIGDLLFTVANLSRYLKINPEIALNGTNKKFIERFNFISLEINKIGENFKTINKETIEKLWEMSKENKNRVKYEK